jgi:hypothetical protein
MVFPLRGKFVATVIRLQNQSLRGENMPRKESRPRVSTLAGKVLKGHKATLVEVKRLAASVLSQDETKGQKRKAKG